MQKLLLCNRCTKVHMISTDSLYWVIDIYSEISNPFQLEEMEVPKKFLLGQLNIWHGRLHEVDL